MAKLHAPHNDRNQAICCEVLGKFLPGTATPDPSITLKVLEVGSGTGQHASYIPTHLHNVEWHPSDVSEEYLASVAEWTRGISNVKEAVTLDASASASKWPVEAGSMDAVYNCNTVHIAPYEVMVGLVSGAAMCLKPGGRLCVYGPFKIDGKCTSESNRDFDLSLKARDPGWGIRCVDFEDINAKAEAAGFVFVAREEMPANNFFCVWERS
ncbi:unnamed protein product [Chrysoparadoxa australica]